MSSKRGEPMTPATPLWRDPSTACKARSHKPRVWRFLLSFIIPPKYYRLLPTTSGAILLVVSMALGGAAYNTSSNILFMCLSLMMGCIVLSGLLSFINFRKLRWMLEAPEHLRAGETGLGRIWVENEKTRIPTFVLWFHVKAAKKAKRERVILSGTLDPKQRIALNWHIPSVARGKTLLWVSGVESQYPFGFLKKTIGMPIEREVMVWPSRVGYKLGFGVGKRILVGAGKSNMIGEGMDLTGLRGYQLGDDLRKVHWKASARSNDLLIKEFNDENATGYRVWFQTSKALWINDETFERACALVGSVVEDLYRKNELIAFCLDEDPPIAGRSVSEFYDIMSVLSFVQLGHGSYNADAEETRRMGITFKPGEGTAIDIYLGHEHVGTTIQ